MKTLKDIKAGDYIFHCCKELPEMTQCMRVVEVHDSLKEIILGICWFGRYVQDTFHYLHVNKEYIDEDKFPDEHDRSLQEYWYQTEWNIENKGIGRYIYNKSKDFEHREYEVIQEKLLFKDIDFHFLPMGLCEYKPNYYWRGKGQEKLILYKAVYEDCPDGPYFVRHAEDFYENFTRIY